MRTTDLIPILVALITGLIALTMAVMNYRATKKLERVKGTYSLLNRDLEKLEQMNLKFTEFSIPSDDLLARTLQLEGDELNKGLKVLYEEVSPQYNSAALEVLANKHLFDSDLQENNAVLISQVEAANSGGAQIGYRIQASVGFLRNLQEQISRNRRKLADNAE